MGLTQSPRAIFAIAAAVTAPVAAWRAPALASSRVAACRSRSASPVCIEEITQALDVANMVGQVAPMIAGAGLLAGTAGSKGEKTAEAAAPTSTVSSRYDAGLRLTTEAAAPVEAPMSTVSSWYDAGMRLTSEAPAPTEAPTSTVSSWYDAGMRLTTEAPAPVEAKGWPSLGGSSGPHRGAGRLATKRSNVRMVASWYDSGVRLVKPEVAEAEPAAPAAVVKSWYDAGVRLVSAEPEVEAAEPEAEAKVWPSIGGSSGLHRMAGRVAKKM